MWPRMWLRRREVGVPAAQGGGPAVRGRGGGCVQVQGRAEEGSGEGAAMLTGWYPGGAVRGRDVGE